MLTWFDERLIQYPKPVAIAWQTSFDQLTAPARQLLQRLAWLAPDPIPESLMEVPVPENDEQIDAFEPLAELESYSLVNRATDRPSFSVHRLVQEVTRRKERDDSVHTALIEAQHWIDASFIGDPQNPDDRPVLNPLLTHVLGVSAYADETGITEPTARLMNQAGRLLDAKAQYAEAEPLYLRALAIREQILEPNHPDVAQSLNDLAELYRTQGVYAQAEPLHQRALAILEQAMGPDHPDVAQSLNDLAELYRTQSVYAQAEPLHQRALAIREQVLGPDHPAVAQSLNNLAELYRTQSVYAQAKPLYQQSLAVYLVSLGIEHPTSRTVLQNYEGLLQEMGKTEAEIIEALQSLKQQHMHEAP